MLCGTRSPIVSDASLRRLGKSFTFSLIMKRCSWVRLFKPSQKAKTREPRRDDLHRNERFQLPATNS